MAVRLFGLVDGTLDSTDWPTLMGEIFNLGSTGSGLSGLTALQLDGTDFPKNPLTKTWQPQLVAIRGHSEPIFSGLWTCTLNFGILESAVDIAYLEAAHLAGGLHTARLPHPQTGNLVDFTNVSIESLVHTFDEWDSDAYNSDTVLTLGRINVNPVTFVEPTVSGTYQVNGLLPKNPLTKRWQRSKLASGGRGAAFHANLWQLELNFGTLEIKEHGRMFQKFMDGGLNSGLLPHPANGQLTQFTGVSILNYSFSFGDVDNNGWALSPVMALGVVNPTTTPVGWFDLNWTARQCLTIQTTGSAASSGYSLRFYVSGSAADTILSGAQGDPNNIRIHYQSVLELDRDVHLFGASEVEVIFPLQASMAATQSNTSDYCLYYARSSGTATPAPSNMTTVYDFYEGWEGGPPIQSAIWTDAGATGTAAVSSAQAAAGTYSLQADSYSVSGTPVLGGVENLGLQRAEITLNARIDGAATVDQIYINGAFPQPGRGDTSLDEAWGALFVLGAPGNSIFWQSDSSIDTGLDVTPGTWQKLEIEGNRTDSSLAIRLDDSGLYSGALQTGTAQSPLSHIQFRSTYSAANISYFDEIKIRGMAQIEPTITSQGVETI